MNVCVCVCPHERAHACAHSRRWQNASVLHTRRVRVPLYDDDVREDDDDDDASDYTTNLVTYCSSHDTFGGPHE